MRIWDSDIPGFTTYVGMDVTGIGDYNGDGIDDFAFSAVHIQVERSTSTRAFRTRPMCRMTTSGHSPLAMSSRRTTPTPSTHPPRSGFALPVAGHTELLVYNVLGEKVKTLVDRRLSAGSYTLEWDGTNATGDPVASGVYVYRLTSGEFVTSRKMVLVR